MGKPIIEAGRFEFILTDNREVEYNESTEVTFYIWQEEGLLAPLLSIEDYWHFCRRFAASLGFTTDIINEYFGE